VVFSRASTLALVVAAGCGRGPFFVPEIDPCDDNACTAVATLQRSADILFVIDNSGSMGVEQGVLASNFPSFFDVLERQQFGTSYRLGLTTTDAPGDLRVSSCRERLEDFVFVDDEVVIDESQSGCLASCATDVVGTVPTTTADDPEPLPRPWIEKAGNHTNLADGISVAEAMRCAGPQGINGWGLEAPLEAMNGVIEGRGDSQGFLRDEALLAVVFVTDETDCSMPPGNDARLAGDEGRALWSDPFAEAPTSAVCWNAGTTCTGGPGSYDECHAEDHGWDGQPAQPGEETVLYPVSRYVDALRELSQDKSARGGTGQVLVAVIGGVPLDYPETGVLPFQDSDDPDFNLEYGIGPSCGRGTETVHSPPGIPPVRLREFAEAFAIDGRNLFSICSGDYTVALEQIAGALGRLSARTCVPGCVADYDDDEPGLQPNCRLVERSAERDERVVPRCMIGSDGWTFPGTSLELCYRPLIDEGGDTPTIWDDLSRQCLTQGANLELVVERPQDVAEPPGTTVEVQCELTRPVGESCDAPTHE
jgi:hypothetical protein